MLILSEPISYPVNGQAMWANHVFFYAPVIVYNFRRENGVERDV